jgi:hypothetical protein
MSEIAHIMESYCCTQLVSNFVTHSPASIDPFSGEECSVGQKEFCGAHYDNYAYGGDGDLKQRPNCAAQRFRSLLPNLTKTSNYFALTSPQAKHLLAKGGNDVVV